MQLELLKRTETVRRKLSGVESCVEGKSRKSEIRYFLRF